jgi:hypothetical protein
MIEEQTQQGWKLLSTSAKTGMNVEEAFLELSMKMLET